jgi:hypothetical protein
MKTRIKTLLGWSALLAAIFVTPGFVAAPAEGKQWRRTNPAPRVVLPFDRRVYVRPYRAQRKCHVQLETQAEKNQKSIARRLCNSAIVDERAEGTSSFH